MRNLPVLLALVALPWTASLATPTQEWAVTYDGGGAYDDFPTTAITDAGGNLVLAGYSYDGVDGYDMIVRKYDAATGDTLWHTRVTAYDGSDITVTGLVLDGDGQVLVGGHVVGCVG